MESIFHFNLYWLLFHSVLYSTVFYVLLIGTKARFHGKGASKEDSSFVRKGEHYSKKDFVYPVSWDFRWQIGDAIFNIFVDESLWHERQRFNC